VTLLEVRRNCRAQAHTILGSRVRHGCGSRRAAQPGTLVVCRPDRPGGPFCRPGRCDGQSSADVGTRAGEGAGRHRVGVVGELAADLCYPVIMIRNRRLSCTTRLRLLLDSARIRGLARYEDSALTRILARAALGPVTAPMHCRPAAFSALRLRVSLRCVECRFDTTNTFCNK
jgi:hypothetical protein